MGINKTANQANNKRLERLEIQLLLKASNTLCKKGIGLR